MAINVLSLFDGMSCGQIALERAGIKVNNYFASEIDKYAQIVSKANYPNTIYLGDVINVKASDLPKIDLIIGGSPCQSFSFAGKRKGMSTKDEQQILTLEHYLQLKNEGFEFEGQSYLFWEYMRLLNECKPKNFLLENVEMGEKWEKVLSKAIGVNGIHINSALVSAQNRKRIYWTNIGMQAGGLFGGLESVIEHPKDKGILLKDVLESHVLDKYYLSDKLIEGFERHKKRHDEKGTGFGYNPKNDLDKGNSLRANAALCPTDNILIVASRGRNPENPKSRKTGLNTEQMLEQRFDNKTNCLTTVQKDNLVMGCDYRTDEGFRMRENGKSGTLAARARNDKSCGQLAKINTSIRRLTPLECERLQTVPDNEIICIFALCLDQIKNYVIAVEQNPKLLKLALSAEKTELVEFAKLANQNTQQSNQQTKFIAHQNAGMMIQRQINQCTVVNQKESNIIVKNAVNTVMYKNQNQEADTVLSNVFINITEGKIIHFGKEELHQKGNLYTNQVNGKKPLFLYGKEIMQLVKDVDAEMKKHSEINSISTTLSVFCIKSLEQMLATYYLFAKNVIIGYTQDTINQKNLLVQFKINDGYTNHVSDSQRYKMLGNGWTVDVISHIFKYL